MTGATATRAATAAAAAAAGDSGATAPRRRAGLPAIYDTSVHHVRTTPLRNAFRYRSYQWLVDLDDLPRLPRLLRPLARFESRDHLGDPDRSLRANVDDYLAGHGIDLGGGQVVMLTNARVLGYVFNPLTVLWCHRRDGSLACVVAEVHNTYSGRHRYLLHTDERGGATTDKQFYVSPFYPVDGHYRMSLPEPDDRLDLTITLHRPQGRPFVASVTGTRHDAGARGLLRAALRVPWSTLLVALQIRRQGIALWLRGLPVVPRPAPTPRDQP